MKTTPVKMQAPCSCPHHPARHVSYQPALRCALLSSVRQSDGRRKVAVNINNVGVLQAARALVRGQVPEPQRILSQVEDANDALHVVSQLAAHPAEAEAGGGREVRRESQVKGRRQHGGRELLSAYRSPSMSMSETMP